MAEPKAVIVDYYSFALFSMDRVRLLGFLEKTRSEGETSVVLLGACDSLLESLDSPGFPLGKEKLRDQDVQDLWWFLQDKKDTYRLFFAEPCSRPIDGGGPYFREAEKRFVDESLQDGVYWLERLRGSDINSCILTPTITLSQYSFLPKHWIQELPMSDRRGCLLSPFQR